MPATCRGKICVRRFRGGKIRFATFWLHHAPGADNVLHPWRFSCHLGLGGVSPYLLHMTRRADLLIQLEEYFCCRAGLDFGMKLEFGLLGPFRCLVRRIS